MSFQPVCFVVGPFPPPVNGSSVATAAMCNSFEREGVAVRAVNIATNHTGALLDRLRAVFRHIAGFSRFLWKLAAHRGACVYLPVSGGHGQYRDVFYLTVARLFASRILLHHHSFSYLDHPWSITRCLSVIAGPQAIHLALCSRMRELLHDNYPAIKRTMLLSNAVLTPPTSVRTVQTRALHVLGFMSNITIEKGIDRFVHLVRLLRVRGLDIEGYVAGPVVDAAARAIVEDAVADGSIVYHGPVHAARKQAFLDSIDLFVFPSRYPNEAEPFAILEALASGVPVIATARGCIATLIDGQNGILLDSSADDLEPAVAKIQAWISAPAALLAARNAAISHVAHLREEAGSQLRAVVAHVRGDLPIRKELFLEPPVFRRRR